MSLPKVLVVDDHPMNRKLATMLLRNAGYPHDEAESGEQALERLAGGDFGVVLLDVSMPGISGEEVCRRIRADERLKGLRVIAYTAHAFEDERSRILAEGFDALLTKPISRDGLLSAVAGTNVSPA
jgi:CheY-like chemotaxis protein